MIQFCPSNSYQEEIMKLKPVFWILIGVLVGSVIDVSGITTDTLEKQVVTLQSQVTDLEKRVTTLESALKVTAAGVTLISNGPITVQSATTLSLKGGVLQLNGSGQAVARTGDPVRVTVPTSIGTFTGNGTIVSGSPAVLAQ